MADSLQHFSEPYALWTWSDVRKSWQMLIWKCSCRWGDMREETEAAKEWEKPATWKVLIPVMHCSLCRKRPLHEGMQMHP